MKIRAVLATLMLAGALTIQAAGSAIDSLAMRVTEGTSAGRIEFREVPCDSDFFQISADNGRVVIEGNNPVAMATGLNWYLKYVAGIHLTWNNLTQPLPEVLPLPEETIRRTASVDNRYYLNYCTFSYSMPFWDEDRWMKEIDWMAMHGINMPLSITGIETVWRNLLRRWGYTDKEIGEFISGPAFFAWWQMNNLEGWGGPLPEEWYENQSALEKKIIERMHSLGIEPVFPGFAGMVPSNAAEKLGISVADPGKWCGFQRPAFLTPDDPAFDRLADDYYDELTRLYGTSRYYSMDPFHEGGNTAGVDMPLVGAKVMGAMKRVNPDAVWVVQSWQANPRKSMTDTPSAGDLLILDLYSDKQPKWNRTPGGYGKHEWAYCNLLNFGGNVGLHGRMGQLINGFYDAREDSVRGGRHLTGVGATPEGIENNPVMYELTFELPWRDERFDSRDWLTEYLTARYGKTPTPEVARAWEALHNTVYNCPVDYPGQGTVESLFCARPRWNPRSASTWGMSKLFYDPDSTALAAQLMMAAAPEYAGNANFVYDLTDIVRQANADHGNLLLQQMAAAHENGNRDSLTMLSDEFLALLLTQDSLLRDCPDMNVATWLDAAEALAGDDMAARELYRRNAAELITVWGDSVACNQGGLIDYSHREWSGLLRDLYYARWKAFFDHELRGAPAPDFYRIETDWVDRAALPRKE